MKQFILALGVLLCVALAQAQSIQFEWDAHPEAAQISGFHLYQTKTPGSYPIIPAATFTPGTLTTGSIPKPGLGNYCWVLTAFVPEVDSAQSNEVCSVIRPQPPRLTRAVLAFITLPGHGLMALAQLFVVKPRRDFRIVKT